MTLLKLRFALGTMALLAVIALAILLVFFGSTLSTVQVALLASLIAILSNEVKASSSWAFDGVPVEPETKTTTVSETAPSVAAPPAAAPSFPPARPPQQP